MHRRRRAPRRAPASRPKDRWRSSRVRGVDRYDVHAEPAEARNLERRVAQVEPGYQPHEIDLDTLAPAELCAEQPIDAHLDAGAAGRIAEERSVGAEIAADRFRRQGDLEFRGCP